LDNQELQWGGCQCGQIRYVAPRKSRALYACHCVECRKQSASAFGISFVIARNDLKLVKGKPSFWSRQTAKGHTLSCAFCANCGSRLWHLSTGYPDTLNVKGGSLDEPVDLSSATHIWVASKLPGVIIPAGSIVFDGEPD
jgi:hypothetical protein